MMFSLGFIGCSILHVSSESEISEKEVWLCLVLMNYCHV